MDLDTQQIEIVGRNWLVHELMLAGFEIALPMRDKGVDLLVSPQDYDWTLAVQLKTARGTAMSVDRKYLGKNVLLVYTLLGSRLQALPEDGEAVYHAKGSDYSARAVFLTPEEAWRLPFNSGLRQDLDDHLDYRFAWTTPLKKGLLDRKIALHREEFAEVVEDARSRLAATRSIPG